MRVYWHLALIMRTCQNHHWISMQASSHGIIGAENLLQVDVLKRIGITLSQRTKTSMSNMHC